MKAAAGGDIKSLKLLMDAGTDINLVKKVRARGRLESHLLRSSN